MSTEFTSSGGTRNIEAGDTPGLDYLGVSVAMAAADIAKGDVCYIIGGLVTPALIADVLNPVTAVIPTESIDNSDDEGLEIRVVLPNHPVAILAHDVFTVGQYGAVSDTDGELLPIPQTAANTTVRKFARYMGKEAAIFSIDSTTPFDQTLSSGIVPDQSLAADEVGWFMLVESAL